MKKTSKKVTPDHLSADLSAELRTIVKWSVALLGEIIERELGKKAYQRIESVRQRMASIRKAPHETTVKELEKTYAELAKLSTQERREFAISYTLMLELMNSCENAYRTYRLRQHKLPEIQGGPEAIYYVLTAHPTEARAPDNIAIFHEIQKILLEGIQRGTERCEERLRSLIEIAFKIPIVRLRKPRVQDEAEHIYSILLREVNLSVILDMGRTFVPIFIRSWVGGDKDGHPGVDEKTLADSLQLSRHLILNYARTQIHDLRHLAQLLHSSELDHLAIDLSAALSATKKLGDGDAIRVKKYNTLLAKLAKAYEKTFDDAFPKPLARLVQLQEVFPGLVVPLELREDSGMLMSDKSGDSLAIGRMLKKIGKLSAGEDPTWYARGMIISMCQSAEHILTTVKMIHRQVGNSIIPVVPLFEQKGALDDSPKIIGSLLKNAAFKRMVKGLWNNRVEVMVGYSDSAKESGVIRSRLAVQDALLALDRVCAKEKVTAVFFHGSGGSIDRGGGSIQDQMAGWPASALKRYKATLQGEMIERSFASPEIAESQLMKIAQSASPERLKKLNSPKLEVLENFADKVKNQYQETIHSPRFLHMVEHATPYRYLSALKIGSRPTKRAGALSVAGLRAIPWVLCWTQTRVLFPTWWGIGTAWKNSSPTEQKKLRQALEQHPVFRSYVHALGFTLAKIELPVWELYLSSSDLEKSEIDYFKKLFRKELEATWKFFEELTGNKDPLWYRPWLGKSIELRASMIHPLNILEILAQKDKDLPLLRISVTGIASGMLTTG